MAQELTAKPRNHFIIALAGQHIDISPVNSEEMQNYVKSRKRFAIIGTEKKTYNQLDKMNYQFVMNYTKPKVFLLEGKKKTYLNIYNYLLEKYKSGLMVIESDTISDDISELICNSEYLAKNDIDILICRHGLEEMTDNERRKANFLRIHANPDMDLGIYNKLGDFYKEKIASLMIAQLFVNNQYDEVATYLEKNNDNYAKQGLSDYVDYSELNKQMAYFIYYDVEDNKILNVSKDVIEAFIKKIKAQGLFPMPDESIPEFCQSITVY